MSVQEIVWHVINHQTWESHSMCIRHAHMGPGLWRWCVYRKIDDYTEGPLLGDFATFELAKSFAVYTLSHGSQS